MSSSPVVLYGTRVQVFHECHIASDASGVEDRVSVADTRMESYLDTHATGIMEIVSVLSLLLVGSVLVVGRIAVGVAEA